MSRRRLLTAGLAWPLVGRAEMRNSPPELAIDLPRARLQGRGRLRFLGLQIYDASLWVGDGFRVDDPARSPLAIEIEYSRALNGRRIAERSLAEMKKVGEVTAERAEVWLAEMTGLFPDVNAGDRITGVQKPAATARIYCNGQLRGEVQSPAFVDLFFGIWLSPRCSQPQLRQALLGGGKISA